MFDWSKALMWCGISVAVVVGIGGILWLICWIESTFDLPDGLVGLVFMLLLLCIGVGILGGFGVVG